MRKNLLFLIPVFMMVCFPLSAQQVGTAEKNSAELQTKLDILKSGEGVMAMVAGLDGTTSRFFNRQYGAKCWSPRNGNNAALVAINQAMYDAIGKKDVEIINSKLSDIKSLAKKYASLLQDPYREYYLLRTDKKPANWVTDY